MMDNRGSFYHFVVALAVIVMGGMLWVVLNMQLETVEDVFISVTPNITNSSVHSTDSIIDDYALGEAIFYFSMFGMGVILLFWAIKKTQEERAVGGF